MVSFLQREQRRMGTSGPTPKQFSGIELQKRPQNKGHQVLGQTAKVDDMHIPSRLRKYRRSEYAFNQRLRFALHRKILAKTFTSAHIDNGSKPIILNKAADAVDQRMNMPVRKCVATVCTSVAFNRIPFRRKTA